MSESQATEMMEMQSNAGSTFHGISRASLMQINEQNCEESPLPRLKSEDDDVPTMDQLMREGARDRSDTQKNKPPRMSDMLHDESKEKSSSLVKIPTK